MFGISWVVWAVLALIPAGLFSVVWPRPQKTSPPWMFWVLRWGHSVVWVLLALSCLARAGQLSGVAQFLSLLAGLSYAGFIFAIVQNKP
jgi:hypothetical protein